MVLTCTKRRQKRLKTLAYEWIKNNETSSHMLQDHCDVLGLFLKPSGLKKKFVEEGDPVNYFDPFLDPPLGGSGRKTTTLVRDHEYFTPTKKNPSSVSGEEVENVKSLRRADNGRCAMTIAHSSLRLRRAKKQSSSFRNESSVSSSSKSLKITVLFMY